MFFEKEKWIIHDYQWLSVQSQHLAGDAPIFTA
jgi:hypothetical protein